jgi:hypothetical protein
VCVALGLVVLAVGIGSTSRRAVASAERLAPLIHGTATPREGAHVH